MAGNGHVPTFIAHGAGAQLVVTPTHVIVQRRALGGGDTVIPMDQITAVHLKKPGGLGAFTPGFLRLVLVGEPEATGRGAWAWDLVPDEHAILMTWRHYPEFVRAKELIEQYQAARRGPTGAGG